MKGKIRHFGVIRAIEPNRIRVLIAQTSACESCRASRHCSASESKEKIIDVYNDAEQSKYKVGDGVMLVESHATGMKAVLLGFGIPFVLVILILFLCALLTNNEPVAALASLASLIPYYAILYLFRNKLRNTLNFSIEHPTRKSEQK